VVSRSRSPYARLARARGAIRGSGAFPRGGEGGGYIGLASVEVWCKRIGAFLFLWCGRLINLETGEGGWLAYFVVARITRRLAVRGTSGWRIHEKLKTAQGSSFLSFFFFFFFENIDGVERLRPMPRG